MSTRIVFDVHEGRPSWHQVRAGHISAAVTSGFTSRADADAYIARVKSHHPDAFLFVQTRVEHAGSHE